MSKAHVLLSGGVDSTTCLALALQAFDGSVRGVSFLYGQSHSKEARHAAKICAHYGIPHDTHAIQGMLGAGGLTDAKLEMPNVDYADLPEGMSPTYVPFRNGTLLSLITSHAACDPEAEAIYFGAHADDAANWAYPDCTPEFIGGMANAIYIGTYRKIRLYTPIMWLDKPSIVALGDEAGVPWELTWSCYVGGDKHCGTCPTCRSRRQGFIDADVVDPTEYAADV